MRFAMTAKTLVRERAETPEHDDGDGDADGDGAPSGPSSSGRKTRDGHGAGAIREITARNVRKVTRFRPGGMRELELEVQRLERGARTKGRGGGVGREGGGMGEWEGKGKGEALDVE